MSRFFRSTSRSSRPPAVRLEQLESRETPATLPSGFTEVAVADGLSAATAMEFAPNGDLWITQQGGLLKRFRPGSTTADVVADVATLGLQASGERGLLGIAFDPAYNANKQVYLYYTSTAAPNPHNRVSRFVVNDTNPADYSFVDTNAGVPGPDETVIVDLDALSGATNHNGGAIHFGPDGKLYVAVGDNASGANAQSLANRLGKILRYNPDGSIPADNPTTIAGLGTPTGANRAIWAAGLRNPYTFTFQPGTGRMFVNDVGQNTWEEIDEGGAGRNFGWPTTEGDFTQASFPNFTRPVYTYNHGGGTFQGFAITGGAFYSPTTTTFPADYAGDYFFADYVNDWINVVNADGSDPRRFATGAQSTVDLKVAADGSLYYLGYDSGRAFRVTADPPPTTPGNAAFAGTDTSTQGSWRNTYGAEGYNLAQGSSSLPNYATMSLGGSQDWTWLASTADVRGLQKPAPATDRLAAVWYSPTTFTMNLDLTGGTHRVALYFVDWENAGRAERVEVLDRSTGAVLDTRDVSGFAGGKYLSWDLSGAVQFRFTRTAGNNAVLSGLFFGNPPPSPPSPPTPPGTAAYVGTDTTTQGTWRSAYGAEGYSLSQGPASLPAYATVSVAGNDNWTWLASTADVRGLQKPAPATDRLAAVWYTAGAFTVDLTLTGGTHRVSLYFVDWENAGRAQRVEVLNAGTGAVLDTRDVSAFAGGKYLSWDLAGAVQFRLTRTGGNNAVLSGLFFGNPPPSPPSPPTIPGTAAFVGSNTTTQGTWRGTFGADGYSLAQGASSLPGYAAVAVSGNQDWMWVASTADVRGLQKPAPATDRLAAVWYSSTTFNLDVDITGAAKRVSLYFVDWENAGRAERVEVLDRTTGTVLDTRNLSAFAGGTWLRWDVAGSLTFRITRTGGNNAVVSGVFFDPTP